MNDSSVTPDVNTVTNTNVPSCSKLFTEFARMGLSDFGGVLLFAYASIVDRSHWLSNTKFVELLSLGQVLPGPNVVNLSMVLGYRFHGVWDAVTAMAGPMLTPSVLLLLIVMLYDHFSTLSAVQSPLKSVVAVIAGLVLPTAAKLA